MRRFGAWLKNWRGLKRWQWLSLVALGAVCLWEVAALLTNYHPPHECGGQGESYKDACDYLILVSRPFRPLARLIAHFEHFLIATGSVGLVVFTATLWGATRGLVKGAEVSSNRQLRAYVFPDSAGLFDRGRPKKTRRTAAEKAAEGQINGFCYIKNSGQTPAYKVRHFSNIVICREDEEDAMCAVHPIPLIGAGNLSPGGVMSRNLFRPEIITPEEIAAVKAGTKLIYLYGRIEYLDILGKPRWTNYRLSYSNGYPPYPDVMLLYRSRGNDSDENEE